MKYKISEEARKLIEAKAPIHLRYVSDFNIFDRMINPIGYNDNTPVIVLYSHQKITYIGAAQEGIQVWTEVENKEMPSISTIGDDIYRLIELLEKSGYKIYVAP